METSKPLGAVNARFFKRVAAWAFVFSLSAGVVLALSFFATERHQRQRFSDAAAASAFKTSPIPKCGAFTGSDQIWEESQLRYRHLRDDKFTIAMQTYRRPKELNETLRALLDEEIPSLAEVVVVWNDVESPPPGNFKSRHGVPVRYRQSPENSLNQKLWPDPAYETQAIFLSDDDIHYKPKDLEFVFQAWRKFGRRRMTGGFTRCAVQEANGRWKYSFCSADQGQDYYNLILSGLAFAHISFMDYYSSQDEIPKRIRAYVDQHFNCEDIAMNYLVSLLTGEGPLLVKGKDAYVSFVPANGISTRPGHIEARSQCLNDYNELFKCMPLINETVHIEPGVIIS
ncbi:uncharacterized protein UV8b_06683 [Ustilaginoidea virens]|uniref:Glycosyl transferase 64 domain-containing protein n=1 Tax=Ustilaginoidea virens TaxID=1159556 RepID=A0A8E5MJU3_USTVR|nr:uncharacterized protein UV8b_06683 [Ustilaginoidea virens]QUC22442.1 hypothetical protein UV8b_06683 [Ustilaginoidea virens]